MVYLIGGPPRCGKSTTGRLLARGLGCSLAPGDWLTQAFAMYVPDAELTPPERVWDLGPGVEYEERNDALYARFAADEIVACYRAWARRSWPGLRAFIEYALHDGEDLIVEGYQVDAALLAPWLTELPTELAAQVRAAFLVRDNEAAAVVAIQRRGGGADWVLDRTRRPETFGRIARMIAVYGRTVRAEAERSRFPIHAMDGEFHDAVANAVRTLAGDDSRRA